MSLMTTIIPFLMNNLIRRFQQSEAIINYHLQKEFPLLSLITFQIRSIHFISVILLLCVGKSIYVTHSYILMIHGLNMITLSLINMYIMVYCNTPTIEFVLQGVKTVGYLLGGSFMTHNALSVYFIPPNSISNTYHMYSPTGRGYGAYSCSQLMAVDALKGAQGPDFDPKTIVNKHNMLDNGLISKQFEKTSSLPDLKSFLSGGSTR